MCASRSLIVESISFSDAAGAKSAVSFLAGLVPTNGYYSAAFDRSPRDRFFVFPFLAVATVATALLRSRLDCFMRSRRFVHVALWAPLSVALGNAVGVCAFCRSPRAVRNTRNVGVVPYPSFLMAGVGLGEFTVSLTKPLGIILEERNAGKPGVCVASLVDGGAADNSGAIVKGDALVAVDGRDLTQADFDTAMDVLITAPGDRPLDIVLSDGLGRMDIAKNLAKSLSSAEAVFADATVRAAVRQVRKIGTQLGDLLNVEIVIGAGVQDDTSICKVTFFALFSTDTVSTYSCSVSATGRQGHPDGAVEITQLSCAKDEGWGQTYDLIREAKV